VVRFAQCRTELASSAAIHEARTRSSDLATGRLIKRCRDGWIIHAARHTHYQLRETDVSHSPAAPMAEERVSTSYSFDRRSKVGVSYYRTKLAPGLVEEASSLDILRATQFTRGWRPS